MRVIWSEAAIEELSEIDEYLGEIVGNEAARKVIDRILSRAERIAKFPESGRIVVDFRSPRIREIIDKPYRIVYEIRPEEDRVEVVAVFHGSRLPPWQRDEGASE